MEKECYPMNNSVEMRKYYGRVWHKTNEQPVINGIREHVEIITLNKDYDVSDLLFDKEYLWKMFVIKNEIYLWAYMQDVYPELPRIDDYTTIKTYEDACAAFGDHAHEGLLGVYGSDHVKTLMKLEWIRKVLNGGEDIVIGDSYIPRFTINPLTNTCKCTGAELVKRPHHLSLDSKEKATYFGKQFIDLWSFYLTCDFSVVERIK